MALSTIDIYPVLPAMAVGLPAMAALHVAMCATRPALPFSRRLFRHVKRKGERFRVDPTTGRVVLPGESCMVVYPGLLTVAFVVAVSPAAGGVVLHTMNRVLRIGIMILGVLALAGATSWSLTGGGAYTGSPDHYQVTVRMWLNDLFVGGIQPTAGWSAMEASVLGMLAAGNDLIFVDPDAPRCPVWSVAWVGSAPDTAPGSQVYNAMIQCSRPGLRGWRRRDLGRYAPRTAGEYGSRTC